LNAPRTHWLYRPRTRRVLAWVGAGLLALSVLAEFAVHLHPAFGFDAWFGFNAVYGFLACVAMVLFAKLLGFLVKRPDDYYNTSPPHAGAAHGRDRGVSALPGDRPAPKRRGRSHGQLLHRGAGGRGRDAEGQRGDGRGRDAEGRRGDGRGRDAEGPRGDGDGGDGSDD